MECSPDHKVSKEEVIAKLKDDGDFDRLRRKIIQKLKHREELRETIISIVKQSAALKREGAEKMKPRQLSDDIHQEVGEQVMSHISDGLWDIIRSNDGMKSEITETVQAVYSKLTNPKGNAEGEASTHDFPVKNEAENNGLNISAASEITDTSSDNEPRQPRSFSGNHQKNNGELPLPLPHLKGAMEERKESPHQLQDKLIPDDIRLAPGFSTDLQHKQAYDGSDEDPDVPPGFG